MRTPACVAAVLLLAASLAAPAETTKFQGVWEATFRGKVILVLKIQAGEKQRITGTLNAGSISLNDAGELIEATPPHDLEAPFFFAKVDGDKLEFDYQDQGDDEVMHFELKLTGEASGELRIVDEHVPNIKPFALRKKPSESGA